MWGLVLLFAWHRSVFRLTQDRAAAMVALACIGGGLQRDFLGVGGRMDMMAVALGSLGIAAYLRVRETSVPWALLWGGGLAACACLTHPNAIFFVIDLIFWRYIWIGRRFCGGGALAGFAMPYVVRWAGGAIHCRGSRAFCDAVFGKRRSAGGRFLVVTHPLLSLRNEVVDRYFAMFGMPPFSSGAPGV